MPLYKNVNGAADTANPYNAVGKEVTFNISCRDVLGNYADGGSKSVHITPVINDFMIGIHEWAGVGLTFDIESDDNGNIYAVLNFSANNSGRAISNEQKEIIQRSLYQLQGAKLGLTGAFIESIDIDGDRTEQIIQFGTDILLHPNQEQELCIKLPIRLSPDIEISPLSLTLRVSRSFPKDFPLRVGQTESVIRPHIDADTQEGASSDASTRTSVRTAADFSADTEAALGSAYKVGFADEGQTNLYLINIAAMLPELSISCGDEKTYPNFFAYPPLSNKPMSGVVEVAPLSEAGKLADDDKKEIGYTDVDIDKWAERFIEDVESLLAANVGAQLYTFSAASIDDLISAKEELASAISACLQPVEADTLVGLSTYAIVKDRLLKNLASGSRISCAAEYEITSSEFQNIRLVADIRNSSDDAGLYTIGECKIDLSQQSCVLVLSAQSAYQSGFSLNNLEVSIRDIEYNIQKMDNDYETSKWLRFVIPLSVKEGRIRVDFSSSIDAPNPLRSVPKALKIISQAGEPSKAELYQWKHTVNCLAFAAEQDSHEFTIKYTDEPMFRSNSISLLGLFEGLAQYDYVREALLKNIHSVTIDAAVRPPACGGRMLQNRALEATRTFSRM